MPWLAVSFFFFFFEDTETPSSSSTAAAAAADARTVAASRYGTPPFRVVTAMESSLVSSIYLAALFLRSPFGRTSRVCKINDVSHFQFFSHLQKVIIFGFFSEEKKDLFRECLSLELGALATVLFLSVLSSIAIAPFVSWSRRARQNKVNHLRISD